MLKIDDLRTLQGFQVNGDDQSDHTFYIFPENPTFARMANGALALRFVEYGQLREDGGKKFGGFIAFDVELSVPADKQKAIVADLQKEVDDRYRRRNQPAPPVQIAPINYTDGTVSLLLTEGGALIERIRGAGKPSLYGRNIASFMMELSELGTAIFKETLSKGSASAVQVVYNLNYFGRLPKMSAWGTWNASEFYSFFQDVNTEDNFWSEDSYTEVISSSRYKNDVTKTHFEFAQNPNLKPEDQAKLEADVHALIEKQLAAAVQRNLLKEIADVDPNVKNLNEEQDIEDIRRTINKTQIANVRVEWSEEKAIITEKHPQGMLPTITSMVDGKGKALRWEDHYSKINVDEFLKTLQVTMRVNADFETLPIHSVEVKIRYPHGPNAKVQEFTFTKPDDMLKFECFVHQGIRKFFYSYTVNYRNSSHQFQSKEVETDDTNLTIGVDDLGVLVLDIAPGDINFKQVGVARVVVRYDGDAEPIEARFNMTEQSKEFSVRQILAGPRKNPVKLQTTYQTADGREIKGPEREQRARNAYIDDPFTAMKTVAFRAAGDLANEIVSINLEAAYADGSGYTQKTMVTLSKAMSFFDWTFPVIDENAGEVTYSGSTTFADGTTRPIKEEKTKRSVIQVGSATVDFLDIAIVPDLLDWSKVKLVNVALAYEDKDHEVNERVELRFKSGDAEKKWRVPLKDANRTGYGWVVTYFLADGTRKTVEGPADEKALSLFLELPA